MNDEERVALPEPQFPDRETVIRAAQDLAQAAWTRSGQSSNFYMDPAELARYYGCDIRFAGLNPNHLSPQSPDYKNSSLEKPADSTKVVITLEKRDPLVRQRFSAAHEIGHYLWFKDHMSPEAFYATPISGVGRHAAKRPIDDEKYFEENQKEYFADMFAHMFLIPSSETEELADLGEEMDLEAEASQLRVSEETLRNRLYYHCLEVARNSESFAPQDSLLGNI